MQCLLEKLNKVFSIGDAASEVVDLGGFVVVDGDNKGEYANLNSGRRRLYDFAALSLLWRRRVWGILRWKRWSAWTYIDINL